MGGKGSSVTVGYRYKVMFHMGLSLGPIDAFLEFRCGDQTAWSGELTQSGTISINQPNLFGGDKDQGGVVSDVDVMFGEPTQQPSPYLIATLSSGPLRHLDGWVGLIAELAGAPVDANGNLQLPAGADAHVPAWRGLSTIVFKGGTYGSNNPYPQKASYKIRKIKMGWDGDPGDGSACWYPETAEIVLAADTVLPADADGWDYQTVPQAPNPGTTDLTIPTDGWVPNGRGPFSGGSTQSGGNTNWPVDTTLWLKRSIQIDGINQTLRAAVDNGCVVFVNGAIIGSSNRADASIDHNERNPVVFPLSVGSTAEIAVKCFNEVPPVEPSGVYASVSIAASGLTAMNPAHTLYYARTQQHMGRRPVTEIDDASHRAAADWYASQSFGICWDYDPAQESVDQFIERIEKVAGCSQSRSPLDGKWYLDIANGEYDLASLPILTDDDILDFQRQPTTPDSAVNSVSVQYRDPQQKTDVTTPPVQALALVNAFGTIHQDISYPEIPTGDLGLRVAQRELNNTTTPTNGFELTVTRRAYAWRRGMYFRLQTPKRGIADMVCIVGSVDTGTLKSGAIKLTVAQDIYALPSTSFVSQETGIDTRPSPIALAIVDQAAFEAPYTSVMRSLSRADLDALPSDVGYLMTVASAPQIASGYTIEVSTDSGNTYAGETKGPWCPTALIVEDDPLQDGIVTDFTLADGTLLTSVLVGSAALWDGEIVRVDAIDTSANPVTLILGRGCADATPQLHSANSRIWFFDGFAGTDPTEYTDGETIDVALLTNTGSQQLDPADANSLALTFDQRQFRPYPPANLRINGNAYPAQIIEPMTLTWSTRNRLTQADQLIDTTQLDVAAEANTTYTVRTYLNGTLATTQTDIADTTAHPDPGGYGIVRVEIDAVRDGVASFMPLAATFDFISSLRITTTAINIGTSASATFQMAASGANPPFTWTATGLPVGLSMDVSGLISNDGSAAAAATNCDFTVTDASGSEVTQTLTVTVAATFLSAVDTLMPVAHWRMDDAASSTALVDRIAGASATLSGSYALGASGLLADDADAAVAWSGGHASTAAAAQWALGSGDFSVFTIAQWTTSSRAIIASSRDSANVLFDLIINNFGAGQIQAQNWDYGNTSQQAVAADKAYNDGQPHAIGITFEAATNTMRIYVDGSLKDSQVQGGTRPTTSSMYVTLGANFDGGVPITGIVDEMILFERLLTDTDMAQLASYVVASP